MKRTEKARGKEMLQDIKKESLGEDEQKRFIKFLLIRFGIKTVKKYSRPIQGTAVAKQGEARGREVEKRPVIKKSKSLQCASGVECCYEFAFYLKLMFSLDLFFEMFQGKVM